MTRPSLGERNNNPSNLRPGFTPWQGQIGSENNYCQFDTMENGIRAAAKQVLAYHNKHALHSVRAIISRWAPPSDNNDTEAYIGAVSKALAVDDGDWLNLNNDVLLGQLLEAIFLHENGYQPTTSDQVIAGIAAAHA